MVGTTARRAAAIVCAAALAACDGGKGGPHAPPPDEHTVSGTLSLDEKDIGAHADGGDTRVDVVLKRTGNVTLSGRVKIELVRLADQGVEASGEAPFTANAASQQVTVPLPFHLPDDGAARAGYVLSYRIEWPGDALWGRRSLFMAAPPSEAELVGPDHFQTGVRSFLRLIARDPRTGAPLADVPVSAHLDRDQGPAIELPGARTDEFGQVSLPVSFEDAQAGDGKLVVQVDAPDGAQQMQADVQVERATKVLLTTDKPIYQPGQQIHLRALALRRPNLAPDADQPVVFEVFDGKGNKLEHTQAQTDAYGIASTSFRIAREVNMGSWKLSATVGEAEVDKTVTVDRYALPKYDVDVQLGRDVYLAGDRLEGTIALRYFFGQPVRGGTVALVGATLDAGRTEFAEVQGATNDEGLFPFSMQLPSYVVGLPLEQGGGLVELDVTATDAAGQQRQVAKTIRVAPAALEVAVVPEGGEIAPGLENQLLVRSLDAAGHPVGAHVEMTVNGAAVDPFDTDANGMARVAVQVAQATAAVHVVSTDADGHRVTNDFTFQAGDGHPDGAVLVRTDAALYKVGQTLGADVEVVGAPDRVYLDVIRSGQTVLTQILTPDANGRAHYDLELTNDHTGALQIDAYYLAQGSSLRRDTALVYVEPADALSVSVQSDRDVYAPADQAHLTFHVTNSQGVGKAAALGLQIVDEAVYGLMEFRPGLEKTYFQIEADLAQPRYQIGVPDLPTLAADPAAPDDAQKQDEARLLFAAGGAPAGGLDVNTFRAAQAGAQSIVQPAVQALADTYFQAIRDEVNAGRADYNTLPALIGSGFAAPYDPWGKLVETTTDQQNVTLRSFGPDEIADTADDIRINKPFYEVAYGDRAAEGGDFDGPFPAAGEGGGNAAGGEPPAPPPEEPGAHDDGGNQGAPRVRRDFPETLLVEPALITDAHGEATLDVPLADSITTWRLSAMANSADGLLGSTDAGLRVFQDFFTDVDLPATLTRGDEYSAPIALYNYLDRPQTVQLQVQPGDWFELQGPADQEVDLAPGEVKGVRLPIRVTQVGTHELTVFAIGDQLQDAVARSVQVQPDGQEVRDSSTGRLEGTVSKTVTIPADAIEGSGELLVKIYPGLFATVVEGMDGVLQMPSGCFEQTSSTTWPDVLVESYMRQTGTVTPDVDARAMEYVNTGYQRLLTFEVPGGGFEWFGQAPSHVVLTAYGLLEFTDMAKVRTVDDAMIARTRAFLLGQQKPDGSWAIAQRGLDETGNLTDPVTVTAYVSFALAAAGVQDPALDRARGFLEQHLGNDLSGMGTYTLALFANFMAAHDPNAPLTGRLMDELAQRVSEAVQQGGAQPAPEGHWETDEQTTTWGQGEPAWIETTALATHALLVAGAHPDVAQEALSWLVTKKDPNGAWGSTAGTVWTIKCLLQALSGGHDDHTDATVSVRLDGQERASFRFTPDTADVMRQADLSALLTPGQDQLVEVQITGEGRLMYGIVSGFHRPWDEAPPPAGPLSIDVTYDRTQLAVDDTVAVNVHVANDDLAFADMVMVDLGIPPGFDLVTADLDALVQQGVFRKYEHTERQLLLYFDVIRPENPVSFQYHIVARDPIRAQAPRSRIYSYYNAAVGSETMPVDIEVR